ncbi:MAG: acyltransferase family protein [Microthrixaceae bacterium]|nr:acyltransferase family protein [Microthrixaceae bacterium]
MAQRSMSQLWTLSLEEQFYMVIGVAILVAVTRRWVKALVVAMVALALAAQWGRATGHYGPFMIAMQRPDALLLGSVLAILNAHWGEFDARARTTLKWIASVSLAVGALTMFASAHPLQRIGLPYWEGYPELFESYTADVAGAGGRTLETYTPSASEPGAVYFIQFGHTIVIWAALPFVLGMARVKDWGMNRFLQWRPFMYMGRLSYSLYIWHGIGIMVAFALIPDATGLPQLLVRSAMVWIISFALAIPVYRYVELRFQRIKLSYSAEKTAVDVSTGKEVDVATGESVEDPPG